jgi:hypothetical protein
LAKQSTLDKAIAQLDEEIAVLQAARARLVAQRPTARPATRRVPRRVGPSDTPDTITGGHS